MTVEFGVAAMRKIAVVFLVAVVVAAGYFEYSRLMLPDVTNPQRAMVALIIGAALSILVDIGLMVQLFYTDQRGYDEPPWNG
jgi:hypothetical protein